MSIPLWIAAYLIVGTLFGVYMIGRLEPEDGMDESLDAFLLLAVLLWPAYLCLHIYKSVKRGSFKREKP